MYSSCDDVHWFRRFCHLPIHFLTSSSRTSRSFFFTSLCQKAAFSSRLLSFASNRKRSHGFRSSGERGLVETFSNSFFVCRLTECSSVCCQQSFCNASRFEISRRIPLASTTPRHSRRLCYFINDPSTICVDHPLNWHFYSFGPLKTDLNDLRVKIHYFF